MCSMTWPRLRIGGMLQRRTPALAALLLCLLAELAIPGRGHPVNGEEQPHKVEVETIESVEREGSPESAFNHLWLQGDILYVSDSHDHVIFSNHTGKLEIFAGVFGRHGFHNGPRLSALFYRPRGICVDVNGSLIVADSLNGCIRRVTGDGEVETLAGQCESPGFQDGRADEARFSDSVYDVFCTAPGCSVLVSDPSNGRLRRIARDPAACEAEQHAFHRHGVSTRTFIFCVFVALLAGSGTGFVVAAWYEAIEEQISDAIRRRDASAAAPRSSFAAEAPLLGEGGGAGEAAFGPHPSPGDSLIELDTPAESPLSVLPAGGHQQGGSE